MDREAVRADFALVMDMLRLISDGPSFKEDLSRFRDTLISQWQSGEISLEDLEFLLNLCSEHG
jgi:hypothetical protein